MSSLNLPPLPPMGGETTGRNVVDVITEEHRELLELCDRLVADPEDKRLAGVVIAELSRHLSAEEQYLYPAVRRTVPGGDELADRELAEDRQLLVTLQQLQKTPAAERARHTAAVAEAVRRHVDADAEELLPVLVQMVPIEDLIRVGNRFETAEEAAPTRPHPSTPSTPPWNKVVDPAVAVLDKLRDAVTGRTTYSKDL
ncbi:hemerythrin domain-containing protein [Paractinoplanes ovalisporus]|uniref:hemerythrin domain-containing protein n=1 Tax=Paractinoplanes ovalisporus TaxID=2810368 RepID=UPI0027DCDEDA|nr:hemerythrin domain-containing protein [Actinoplanes ovalisporus]